MSLRGIPLRGQSRRINGASNTFVAEGSLYFHWPYCAKRCTYCNFNKYIMKPDQTVDQDRMGRALMAEMKTILNLSGFQRVRSVFFGGGTPSMMKPDIIQNILKHLNSQYGFDPSHSELTIEANPNDVSANVMSWASMGFNRISLGLQSLAEDDLKLLNRDHNPQQGLNALELCLKHVPSGTTCDLMFGRPGQTLQSWQQELNRILEYPLKHISLYELTVERGTPLWKDVQAGTLQMPNGDTMAAMYEEAIERLADCDLERYEVSNFAKLGFESVHNSAYWHGGEYIGIGPGAHGRFCIRNNQHSAKDVRACDWIRGNPISTTKKFQTSNWQARIQTLEPDHWMREVELAGHGTRKIQALSLPDYFESVLMSSLRTKSGMNGDWLKNMSFTFPDLVSNCQYCQNLADLGFIECDKSNLRLTSKGMSVADQILPYFINSLDLLTAKSAILPLCDVSKS